MDRPIHVDRDPSTGAATVAVGQRALRSRKRRRARGAKWMMGFPDITGSVPGEKEAEKKGAGINLPARPVKPPDGKLVELDAKPVGSPSERAILERLQERRLELDSRNREIELREGLLQAAREEVRGPCQRTARSRKRRQRPFAEKGGGRGPAAQESHHHVREHEGQGRRADLRPAGDAHPGRGSLADQSTPHVGYSRSQMSPEAAERLTVELANRASAAADRGTDAGNLPKIEGTPRN